MMLSQFLALLAIICFLSNANLALAKQNWNDRGDTPPTEITEAAEETARFNPFFYALPNQVVEYLRASPGIGTQQTEFASGVVDPQEATVQYETKARQPYNTRRKSSRTTTKQPKRRRPQRKEKPTLQSWGPIKQHPIPTKRPSIHQSMQGMKEPQMSDYEYPPFDVDDGPENFYLPHPPPPLPPMFPYWQPPFATFPSYGYGYPPQFQPQFPPQFPPQEQQFELHVQEEPAPVEPETTPAPQARPLAPPPTQPPPPIQSPPPTQPPQPTLQPQLQLQIPTDQNTLHLLQLALLLQQTLATASAINAASPAATTEAPINVATAVAASTVHRPPVAAAVAPTAQAPAVAVVASILPAVVASLPAALPEVAPNPVIALPTVQTPVQIVPTPEIQQPIAVATTVRPIADIVATAAAAIPVATAATNEDDLIIGDSKPAEKFDSSFKTIITPDVAVAVEPTNTKEEAVPVAVSEVAVSEPVKPLESSALPVADSPVVASPVLYVRVPVPTIKSPVKPIEETDEEEADSSEDTQSTEKEIVATVPYYPRGDDAILTEEYPVVGKRYVKPISYRPDSPDAYQSRRRGKSTILSRSVTF